MNTPDTILVIDDDDFLRQATTLLLSSTGYDVREASTGTDGLRLAREHVPDLILLDVILPDIDGIEVCRQLKHGPIPIESSIMLLSGKIIDSKTQVDGLEAGADDYISRSVSNHEFLARVKSVFRIKKTQQKLANALHTLQVQQEEITRLAKFPNENPNPVLRVTRDGVILYANASSQPLLDAWEIQHKNGDATNLASQHALPKEFLHTLVDVSTSGVHKDIEVTYHRQTFLLTFAPIMDAGYINVYGFDITGRKQAEEALRASEQKLQTLFDALPVGISILDQDRNILEMNAALERILDISHEGLLQKQYANRTYLCSDGTPMPAEEFPSVRAGKEQQAIQGVEIGIVKEDGDTIWTNVSAVPLPFQDWNILVTTTDITEHKLIEQARLRESQALERFSDHSKSSVTAETFNLLPLHRTLPEMFRECLSEYEQILDLALEEQVYKVNHDISGRLRVLADQLGFVRAGPRDVVNLHVIALKHKVSGQSVQKTQAYTDVGRITLLELMGSLVSYYRLGSWQAGVSRSSDRIVEEES